MSRFPVIWWPVLLGAVGALACPPLGAKGFQTSAFLANMTRGGLEVRLFRARGPLDCAAVASAPMNALASTFDPELCQHLEIGGVLPLDRNWSPFDDLHDGGVPRGSDPPCDAVIIRVADLPDTLLTWQQPGYVNATHGASDTFATQARTELDAHAIYLERAGARLFAAGSPLIASLPATIALPDVACTALPDLEGVRASGAAADAGAAP